MKKRFMKKLSLVLAVAMTAACITLPSVAAATEEILIDQNFEGCTTLESTGFPFWPEFGGENGQQTKIVTQSENKVLEITTSDKITGDPWYSNAAQVLLFEEGALSKYTNGYMSVTFDVAPGLRGNQANFMFYLRAKNGGDNVDIALPMMNCDQAILNGKWELKVCDVTPGTWYTITNLIDFANKTATTIINERATGKRLGSNSYTYADTPSTFYFNQYDSKKANDDSAPDLSIKTGSYVDNVKVVYSTEQIVIPDPTPAGIELEDNFDSYSSNSDLTAGDKYSIPTVWGFDENTVSIAPNGTGKAVKLEPASGNRSVLLRNVNSQNTGKVGMDVEITPGRASDNKLVICDSSWKNETIVNFHTDSVLLQEGANDWSNKIGSFTQGKTYKARIVVDLDADIIEVAVTDNEGKTVRGKGAYKGDTVGAFQMAVGAYNDTSGSALFDNLKITANPEVLPAATPEEPEDPTAQKVLWEDNFESYTNINDVTANNKYSNWPNVWRSSVTTDNGSKVLSVMPNDKVDSSLPQENWQQKTAQFIKMFDKTYNSGRIGFSFSVKPAKSGNTNFILRLDGKYEIMAPRFAGSSVLLGTDGDCWNNTIGQVKADTWYDVIVNLDLDADIFEIQLSDAEGNKMRGKQEYTGDFNCFVMGVYSDEFNGAMFDNLKIVTNPDELPEVKELPFRDSFNSYSTIEDAGVNWSCWASEGNTNPSRIVAGQNGDSNKAYYLGLSNAVVNSSTELSKNFTEPITTGKIKVEFDIKPGADVATHVKFNTTGEGTDDKAGFLPLFFFKDKSVGTCWNWINTADATTTIAAYQPDKWYHCTANVDFDGGVITAAIKEAGGETVERKIVEYAKLREVEYESITSFSFQEYEASVAAVGSVFDNVLIDYIVDPPKFEPSGISFMTCGKESTNTTNVLTATDMILLDFGTSMDLASFGEMKLTNAQGAAVKYSLSNLKSRVAIKLEEALQPNTRYTLSIPAAVCNIKEIELGVDQNIPFTTGEGGFVGTLTEVKKGTVTVSGLAQLQAGNVITVPVSFTNATDSNKKAVIIYSYYKANGAMMKSKFESVDVEAGQKLAKDFQHTVEDLTGVTTVKVMLWDGFESIIPLSKSIPLK